MNSLNYSLILRQRLNNTTNNTAFLLISMPVTFISVFTRKKGGGGRLSDVFSRVYKNFGS